MANGLDQARKDRQGQATRSWSPWAKSHRAANASPTLAPTDGVVFLLAEPIPADVRFRPLNRVTLLNTFT